MLGLVRPKAVMPVHGEFRMLAAHARLAQRGRDPDDRDRARRERLRRRARRRRARTLTGRDRGRRHASSTASASATCRTSRCATGATSPRTASLIVVATLGGRTASVASRPELIARGFAGAGRAAARGDARRGRSSVLDELVKDNVTEIKLLQEHLHDGLGQLIYDRTRAAADDPSRGGRGMSIAPRRAGLGRRADRQRGRAGHRRPADPAAERGLGRLARLLPAAGALGPRRRRSFHAGRAAGGAAARGRPRGDRARRARAAARALPARARARARRGSLAGTARRARPS